MTEIISSRQLEAYRTRVLPVAELLRIDRLLAEQADRGAVLARNGDWDRAEAQLKGLRRAAAELPKPHLRYEELEGWVEGTLMPEPRARAEAHLRHCPMCLSELRDFMRFAEPMAQPLPVKKAPQRLRRTQWWGTPALALAATVVLGVGVVQMNFSNPGSRDGPAGSALPGTQPESSVSRAVTHVNDFDFGVFDSLVLATPGARDAYLKDDYSVLAKELSARAGRDPRAASALGLIYTSGALPSADAMQGVQLLISAAQQGDAYAQYNLGVAYERGLGVPADARAAKQWYRAAAAQNLPSAKDAMQY